MKKTLLIVLFSALALNIKADNSELVLRIYNQSSFIASLDRVTYHSPRNVLTFRNIGPGPHYLRAEKIRMNRYGIITYRETVFDGMIEIPSNSKVKAVITRFNIFKIRKVFPLVPVVPPMVVYNPYMQSGGMGPFVLSDVDFQMLVHTIEESPFDKTRLNIAMYAVQNSYVTTSQVVTLMGLMTFESTKLTLAKEAYLMTVDKHRYFAVHNQFTFQSSIRNLNQFIGRG
jgi:uncharacterized protein DUF4476